ncbi:MAG: glycoside hydrolase family 32 protein [Clostridia bacterium]|nr:glycoside hydrolase family 32 protein [Clostridia bacterium]
MSTSLVLIAVMAVVMSSCQTEAPQQTAREQHRLQFHFTPDSMWMNDPNGMVYYNGEYHLFYQYYPDDAVWGPMHWGHAISTDLVHWEHLPVALFPDEHGWIFSGSAVVDYKNTSGLGTAEAPALVAIFTYHNPEIEKEGRDNFQTQGLAYSTDRGRTWHKYAQNPVLDNPGIRDFRDPKVMWYQAGKKWIMTLAAQDHIAFYSSPNLIDWTAESDYGKTEGAHGGVWECPDLFPMTIDGQQKWVLLVSINPGGINGGSATQYFIGDFDGKTFINENAPETVLWVDWGKDNYAGVTWAGIPDEDGRRIFIGWMSNWQYATTVPTERWRSASTLPRTLLLENTNAGVRLISQPVEELKKLRLVPIQLEAGMISADKIVEGIDKAQPMCGELDLTVMMRNGSQFGLASEFGVKLSNAAGEQVLIGYEPVKQQFFVDRNQSGKTDFNENFPARVIAQRISHDETIRMRLFIDVASVELFADDGQTVMTNIFFPNLDFDTITLYARNGSIKLKQGTYYPYKSIW